MPVVVISPGVIASPATTPGTFGFMTSRIATELRRSNAISDIAQAINDAIAEAEKEHFYFNEFGYSFTTNNGQISYPDLGIMDIDTAYYIDSGGGFYPLELISITDLNNLNIGSPQPSSRPFNIAHWEGSVFLYPAPNSVMTIVINSDGKILPSPLVNDTDTNAWMTDGEQYIRALAKRNFLRDIVRDYGEARIYDSIAEGYKSQLLEKTAIKSATGTIRSTQF